MTTAELLLEQQAHAADLQAVLDGYDAQVLAPLAKRLSAAEEAHAAQLQQHALAQEVQQHIVQQLKQEQLQLLQEHQELLDTLAEKEQQVRRGGACRQRTAQCAHMPRFLCSC